MTEESRYGRALSIIYDPKDCPHRDINDRCHHKDNLDNRCSRMYAGFPSECPLKEVVISHVCKDCNRFDQVGPNEFACIDGLLADEAVLIYPDRPSCNKWEGGI